MEPPTVPIMDTMASSRLARARAPRGLRLAAVVLGASISVGAIAAPAGAASDPPVAPVPPDASQTLRDTLDAVPPAPPAPDDPFVTVVAADRDVAVRVVDQVVATQAAAIATAADVAARSRLEVARWQELAGEQVRARSVRKVDVERKRLSDLTVRAYVTGGDLNVEQYRSLLEGDTSDPSAGRKVVFGQVLDRQQEVTTAARAAAKVARVKLAVLRTRQLGAQSESDARRADADAADRRLLDATRAHDDAIAAAAQARADLAAAGRRTVPLVPLGAPILGLPRLDAYDLAGWFATTSYRPRVLPPIAEYARWFIEEGRIEGVRGDIAFAQAVLETGGFTNQDSVAANNFSGIGHCDLCASGWTFASPHIGVRGQIQLLKSYALRQPEYANALAHGNLHGPSGCCPIWGDLTTVWATDPGYGPKVMLIYTDMATYALRRRAAGQGVAPATP
ncbi:MAG: glucosaminidase domain-containing protein [Acidimicrobiales bacterium]